MKTRPEHRAGTSRRDDAVLRLVRELQARTLELRELEHGRADRQGLEARERALEQLRWRLAATVRRTAHDGLAAAA